MIEIEELEIRPLNTNTMLVSWTVAPTVDSLSSFSLSVQRSNSPQDEFVTVGPVNPGDNTFLDEKVNLLSNWRKFYYRIAITDTRDDSSSVSKVVSLNSPPNKIALEIVRRNNLLLEKFVSELKDVNIYIARTTGEHCPVCYDKVKKRVTKSNCDVCFNTGYTNGFFPPITAKVNFNPVVEIVSLLDTTEMQPGQNTIWMSNFPLLSPRDMLIETENDNRWRVVNVNKTVLRGYPIHQIAALRLINKNDVEYHIDSLPKQNVLKTPYDLCTNA